MEQSISLIALAAIKTGVQIFDQVTMGECGNGCKHEKRFHLRNKSFGFFFFNLRGVSVKMYPSKPDPNIYFPPPQDNGS